MTDLRRRRPCARLAALILITGLLGLGSGTASSDAAPTAPAAQATPTAQAHNQARPTEQRSRARRAPARVVLRAVSARRVPARIPIQGRTMNLRRGPNRVVLQEYSSAQRRWLRRTAKPVRVGWFAFPARYHRASGVPRYRVVLVHRKRRVDVSNVLRVRLLPRAGQAQTCASDPSPTTCPKPAATAEERSVEVPYCPHLIVTGHRETRTIDWRWDSTVRRWTAAPTPWVKEAGSESERPAKAADCVKLVDGVPDDAALPDIRIKNLTRCGKGDSDATNGTCFKIVPSAPPNPDFPQLEGRKLLKFGVITLNVGAGPGEIIADRTADDVQDWKAYQTFYDAQGKLLGSVVDPNLEFYFAGDGHNHWHVRDFDDYELLTADGTTVARAEKHGYCMQDNTSYGPLEGAPGVSPEPVYGDATSCGKALPKALTIVHGLSRGWGDTYPTTLPDQAIDITDVPDGLYVVRVHADARDALIESDEDNNTAQVQVQITGDTVTVVPGTATGLP